MIFIFRKEFKISSVVTLSFPPESATKTLSPLSNNFSFLTVLITFFSIDSIKQSLHRYWPDCCFLIMTLGLPHLVQFMISPTFAQQIELTD